MADLVREKKKTKKGSANDSFKLKVLPLVCLFAIFSCHLLAEFVKAIRDLSIYETTLTKRLCSGFILFIPSILSKFLVNTLTLRTQAMRRTGLFCALSHLDSTVYHDRLHASFSQSRCIYNYYCSTFSWQETDRGGYFNKFKNDFGHWKPSLWSSVFFLSFGLEFFSSYSLETFTEIGLYI